MCGIAGWYCFNNNRITAKEIKDMFKALEIRGVDATGVAWDTGKSFFILRSPDRASKFVGSDGFNKDIKQIAESRWGFLHTRAATHGSPQNNLNNHPIMNDKGLLVHNGVVYFRTPKLAARGETDSEQLLLNIQKNGWNALQDYNGSASFAFKDFRYKGFYLYTDGNMPLVYTIDKERNILLFCSTDTIMHRAWHVKDIKNVERNIVHYISDKGMKKTTTIKKEFLYGDYTCGFTRDYQNAPNAKWSDFVSDEMLMC